MRPFAAPALRSRTLLIAGALLVTGAGEVGAQTCPGGRQPRAWLGIGVFHCQGGTCVIGGATATMQREEDRPPRPPQPERGLVYDFSIEPRLWEIDAEGPAAGWLRDGDALIAVNGYPITTRDAGRELSAVREGVPVTLLVRRDGRTIPVLVTPETTCRPARVSAGSGPRPMVARSEDRTENRSGGTSVRRSREVPISTTTIRSVGLELAGPTVVDLGVEGEVDWWFAEPPVVLEVTSGGIAERAGVRPGAVLLEVDGRSLTSREGTALLRRFGEASTLRLRLRVAGEERVVSLERHR